MIIAAQLDTVEVDPRQGTPSDPPLERPVAPDPPQRLSPPPNNNNRRQQEFNEARDALNIGPGGIQLGGVAGNLEALLPLAQGNLPAGMLDLPHDMDDEVGIVIYIKINHCHNIVCSRLWLSLLLL